MADLDHEYFIKRALQLAALGAGSVRPNPMVGCVIVHEGKIIGEGFHRQYGGPHAEVNAIRSVTNEQLLPESTLYVTLEPCSHHGKTPPCADLIVDNRIRTVVVAAGDPNPEVNGSGIKKLRKAGINVIEGVLEGGAEELNKRFNTFHRKKRPYVVLKWAETSDGFIARENGDSKWISNSFSRQCVHKWRAEEASILIGRNTLLKDDPLLNVREWKGQDPIKIILDADLRIQLKDHQLFSEGETLVFNSKKDEQLGSTRLVKVSKDDFLSDMMTELHQQNIQSVFVEGGATTLSRFIQSGVWDEARVFRSSINFDKGIKSPSITAAHIRRQHFEGDTLDIYRNPSPA